MEAVARIPGKLPLSERINMRVVVFFGIIALLVGYPVYQYIDEVVSGGIRDAGNGYKEVNLKAMSVFPFDQEKGTLDDIPEKWRALDGQKVIFKGEMYNALSAGSSVKKFELVYSVSKCCFNGAPQIQHFVQCTVMPGKEADYYSSMVKVQGTLHVNVVKDAEGGRITGVYHMDVESVEPL